MSPKQTNWLRTTAASVQASAPAGDRTTLAYNLSANLAAMKLNVLNGKVSGSSLISVAGTVGANAAGFATVNDLLNEANAELGLHGLTTRGSPFRAYQTALRDALSNANGNTTFVQPAPCAFSFP